MLTFGTPGLQPRGISLLLALSLSAGVTAAPRQDTEVTIPVGDSTLSARLVMPTSAGGKVPVVVFVVRDEEAPLPGVRNLAIQLAKDNIASLRYLGPFITGPEPSALFEAAVANVAATVSFLRNDIRFSTITVAGDSASSPLATVAARIARADTSTNFAVDAPAALIKAVRDLDLPGAPKPRRNPGQRASPRDTTIRTIDGARISIEYGRPSKRNRVIWGNLVKWGGWWMPGADESTTLTTNRPLAFGSLAVPAGDYTLYTHPGEEMFTLAVNSETGQFHTVYHPDRDLGRVTMTKEPADPVVERLTFAIHERPGGGGMLKLIWDERAYVVSFVVNR